MRRFGCLGFSDGDPGSRRPNCAIVDVARGNPVRAELLNALRPAVAKRLKQPVRFVVKKLRTDGNWGFAVVEPRTLVGGQIDYSKTYYKPEVDAGAFDGGTCFALLRRRRVAGASRLS